MAETTSSTPGEVQLTDYSEMTQSVVQAIPVQNRGHSFRSQISKTDLLMVTQNRILATFVNPRLENAFTVHNLRMIFLSSHHRPPNSHSYARPTVPTFYCVCVVSGMFARRSKYLFAILILVEVCGSFLGYHHLAYALFANSIIHKQAIMLILNLLYAIGVVETARSFASGFYLVSRNDTTVCPTKMLPSVDYPHSL